MDKSDQLLVLVGKGVRERVLLSEEAMTLAGRPNLFSNLINGGFKMCHVLNMLAHLVEDIVVAGAVVLQDMVAARANIIHLVKG